MATAARKRKKSSICMEGGTELRSTSSGMEGAMMQLHPPYFMPHPKFKTLLAIVTFVFKHY